MDTVFLVGSLVLVLGVVFSCLIKEVPLRMVSGQQARAEAAVARGAGVPGPADRAGEEPVDLSIGDAHDADAPRP